ncbi:hypothetical protein QFZ31_001348 [Neobacillus niacini]|uniref:hypothetical protein n=1 Tax=Neobacillus driksii TaxID=3035913 RepID=UPI0027824575|nr:hypothetical protein [Neobacillus niacini]MDQ0971470.1 hypothetical protein [Neobacillus niacini]
MARYVSIFFLAILVTVVLTITTLLLIGDIFSEIGILVGTIVVLLGSFIITQLFYIIDLLKKKIG